MERKEDDKWAPPEGKMVLPRDAVSCRQKDSLAVSMGLNERV
jgi:hypothetical protein